MVGYYNFCNKIWNSVLFVISKTETLSSYPNSAKYSTELQTALSGGRGNNGAMLWNEWILSRLARTVAHINQGFADCDFQACTSKLYSFWIHDFCDVFIEQAKGALRNGPESRPEECRATQATLLIVARTWLKLIAPFMPALADEMWHRLPPALGSDVIDDVSVPLSITVAPFPTAAGTCF